MSISIRPLAVVFAAFVALLLFFTACSEKAAGPGATKTDYLFSLRNEYVGNAPADEALLQGLEISKLGNYNIALQTDSQPYILTVNFKTLHVPMDEWNKKTQMYSYILLALIKNVDEIRWNVSTENVTESMRVTIANADKEYNDIKSCGTTSETLHSLLTNVGYYR